tara:strand:- start:68 stop:283 length:216 start_codon:yes stop_codon:yes gene_type:complete
MTTRIWAKKETQSVIGQLRAAGYTVAKVNEIYKILDDGGEVWKRGGRDLFTAMPGNRGYLVIYHDDLLTPA